MALTSVTPTKSKASADVGRVAMAAAPQRVATSSAPPPPARDPSIDEERRLAAEAERQAHRLAAEDKEPRTKLAAALDWAKTLAIRVERNGDTYLCRAFQQDSPPGVAALLRRPELQAVADQELKATFELQEEIAEALRQSPSIVFDGLGRLAKESVPEPLQAALADRAGWPSLVAIAFTRAAALHKAAADRLAAEVEEKHIRVEVIDGRPHVPRTALISPPNRDVLVDPKQRSAVIAALGVLAERQASTIGRICEFISKDGETVGLDGKLKVHLVPKDLQVAATAWANEPEVAAAIGRWVKEQEKITAKLRDQEARRVARREADAARDQSRAGGASAQVDSGGGQAAPTEKATGAAPAAATNAAAEGGASRLANADPSAEAWERLASKVLRREIATRNNGRSVWVEGLNEPESAILLHKKFGDEFARRLFAAVDEIERTFKIVLGDWDEGRIRFTPDGPDLSKLTPEEAALVERHKHRVRIADILDAVRERREAEQKEYEALIALDALNRGGKGAGK